MKYIVALLAIFVLTGVRPSSAKTLIGRWYYEKTKTTTELESGTYAVRETGPLTPIEITFKENHTAILGTGDKTDSLKWTKLSKRKIELAYAGGEPIYKSFNGIFELHFGDSSNLELKKNKSYSIFLKK